MPYLLLDGWPLYYERRGPRDRPLVLFFNGWCLSARYWQEAANYLERDYEVLLWDSRGFGRSQLGNRPRPTSYRATIESGAAEAWQLLTSLGLENRLCHVVGHSLGAVTAAHFASEAEARQQLASLTIVNSGSFDEDEPQGSRLNSFVKVFVKVKRVFDLPLVRSAVIARSVARPIAARYARMITEDFALADEQLALELALSSLETSGLARYRQELIGLEARLLLIVGDQDATIPPKGMYNIKRFKPAAHFVPFADCGHLPMLEQPLSFGRTLAEYLKPAS